MFENLNYGNLKLLIVINEQYQTRHSINSILHLTYRYSDPREEDPQKRKYFLLKILPK